MTYIKLAGKESCDIIIIRGFAFPDCYTRVRIPGLLYGGSHDRSHFGIVIRGFAFWIYIKLAGKESCDIIIHGVCTPLSQSAVS
jgi:hypothetical protein